MKVDELTFDPDNANKGTQRGEGALDRSISRNGVGRSILIDKNGVIIAGNKTAQKAAELGIDHVEVVQTTGNTVVAVQRTDLDLMNDSQARELAYADNRVSELSLDWNAEQMLKDSQEGVDFDALFFDWELDQKFDQKLPEESDFGGMESPNEDDAQAEFVIHVHLENRDDLDRFAELVGQTITERTRYLWYPARTDKAQDLEHHIADG